MSGTLSLADENVEESLVDTPSNIATESSSHSCQENVLILANACSLKGKDSSSKIDTPLSSDKPECQLECAVCLQTCIHPVKLPCCHIFCYLCVKGVAFQSKRCAMCRQEIPADFLVHPQLIDRSQLEKESTFDDGYQWFYEGRNGWWQYDDRTAADIEEMYKCGNQSVELLIAGANYVIDFQKLIQYRKQGPGRIRKIKRCQESQSKLGIAGIRWWQYDERTSGELETAYKQTQRLCELLIAGFLYVIDFDQMLQYRKSDMSRRRRIKRDLASIPKKGVAGLRMEQGEARTPSAEDESLDLLTVAASRAVLNSNNCLSLSCPSQTPQAPSNTPQTPQTPRSPPSPAPDSNFLFEEQRQERENRRLRRAMEEIERLRLHDGSPTSVPYYNLEELETLDNDEIWTNQDSSSEEELTHG